MGLGCGVSCLNASAITKIERGLAIPSVYWRFDLFISKGMHETAFQNASISNFSGEAHP